MARLDRRRAAMKSAPGRLRRSLFQKYFVALFSAVIILLLVNGIGDAWFGYRDQRAMLDVLLRTEAASAATRIGAFLEGIRNQLSWTVQKSWSPGSEEQHRLDALGLLRQVPAVVSITLVDEVGRERLFVSRIALNRVASGVDRSGDSAVIAATADRIYYGAVSFYHESEPFITMGVAGNRKAAGIAVAEINLKLIWDVISTIRIGRTGYAFVLDEQGRLIAHPDISLVLRGASDATASARRRLREALLAAAGEAITTRNADGDSVMAAMAPVPGVNWTIIVEQPLSEAFAPIYLALWRTAGLLLTGAAIAAILGYWLARRMTGPISRLEEGAEKIGTGQFEHRIEISTGDELERLAGRFNRMAGELALSQERSERINRLKRFLAPQVAELVERAGDQEMLASQRAQVVVSFGDLRGFTAFSAHAEPSEIMQVLGDYHAAVGAVITRYEATLINFSGDGLMVLMNAPVPCAEPELRAVQMAIDMQNVVQRLILGWRARGHEIGFGAGLASGPATVGRIGYENRVEYTAIGNVVNLASRLCALAEDGQILIDPVLAQAVSDKVAITALGMRSIKGYERELPIHAVDTRQRTEGAACSAGAA